MNVVPLATRMARALLPRLPLDVCLHIDALASRHVALVHAIRRLLVGVDGTWCETVCIERVRDALRQLREVSTRSTETVRAVRRWRCAEEWHHEHDRSRPSRDRVRAEIDAMVS